MHENLLVNFPEENVGFFKELRKTQSRPKIIFNSIDKNGVEREFKLKMGMEIHSEPTAASLGVTLGLFHDLSKHERTKLRRRIGMVFQDFRLLSHKTAYENIAFAMEAAGREDDEIDVDVPYVLDLVGLRDKIWHFPAELSGGEKQRLAIARAIVNQPDVVIADEPTGNLDPVNTYDVMQILNKINSLGTTVILSTHNKGVVDILENRVVTLKDGRIVSDDESGSYHL
jgi:cell division transport system ATP-binding protein